MNVCRVFQTILIMLLLPTFANPQEIASKDLRHKPIAPPVTIEKDKEPENQKGCEKTGLAIADGLTMAQDKQPRKIKVELVSLSDTHLTVDDEIEATVRLLNSDSRPIRIPWSTDFQVTKDGQDPDNRSWEVGEFQMSIRNEKGQYNKLVNTSELLFGSSFASGSILSIKPGESITAQISFHVAPQDPRYEEITEGPADLSLEWFQTVRTHVIKDCKLWMGYYPYDGFYDHSNRVIVRKVEIKPPQKPVNHGNNGLKKSEP